MKAQALIFILAPFLGTLTSGLFYHSGRIRKIATVSVSFTLVSILCGAGLLMAESTPTLTIPWLKSPALSFSLDFPTTSLVVGLLANIAGVLLHLQAVLALKTRPLPARYFSFLNLTLFALLIILCSKNLLSMLVGWTTLTLGITFLAGESRLATLFRRRQIPTFLFGLLGDLMLMLTACTWGAYISLVNLDPNRNSVLLFISLALVFKSIFVTLSGFLSDSRQPSYTRFLTTWFLPSLTASCTLVLRIQRVPHLTHLWSAIIGLCVVSGLLGTYYCYRSHPLPRFLSIDFFRSKMEVGYFRWVSLWDRLIEVRLIDSLFILPSRLLRAISVLLSYFQTGSIQTYLLYALLGSLWLFYQIAYLGGKGGQN